ncbi:MAG: type sorting protein [Chlorobi bacterium]|nr:type sorting protein [Chlorobiota bacterium]
MKRIFYISAILVACALGGSISAQTWSQKQAMPGGIRDGAMSFSIGSKVYFGAGGGYKDFYEYDPATSKWTKKANIPGVTNERAFCTGFCIGNKGYVGFGYDGNTNIKNDLWEYDPASDKWTRKTDFPGTHRDGVTCFVIGSNAYIGGGSDNQYLFGDFYEYNPAADTWTRKADLPTGPIIFQATFNIGQFGYTVGGGGSVDESAETWRYDPVKDEWAQMSDFPATPRQCAVGFALNGLGYTGFGQSGYATVYNDFYSYNPATNTWAAAGTFPEARGRAWATAAVADGRAYMGSGWDLASTFSRDWWEMNLTVAGIDNAVAGVNALNIYPNPVSDIVNIQISDINGSGRVSLIDALGREIISRGITGRASLETLDVSGLASGVYLVKVESGYSSTIAKLVKR